MFGLKSPGYPLQVYPEEFMNLLSQSYFELAEDTNMETFAVIILTRKREKVS